MLKVFGSAIEYYELGVEKGRGRLILAYTTFECQIVLLIPEAFSPQSRRIGET